MVQNWAAKGFVDQMKVAHEKFVFILWGRQIKTVRASPLLTWDLLLLQVHHFPCQVKQSKIQSVGNRYIVKMTIVSLVNRTLSS